MISITTRVQGSKVQRSFLVHDFSVQRLLLKRGRCWHPKLGTRKLFNPEPLNPERLQKGMIRRNDDGDENPLCGRAESVFRL
jgi:hypothetical protein